MVLNSGNPLDLKTLPDLWQLPVLDSLDEAPEIHNDGDRYRVLSDAVGDWETHDNKIAIWVEQIESWTFVNPVEGMIVYDFENNDWRYVKPDLTWEQFDKIPLAISDVTGLQSALDAKAESIHADTHEEGGSDEITGDLAAVAKINVEVEGIDTKTNRTLNFTAGDNVSLDISEAGGKTIIEITSTGGSVNEFLSNLFRVNDDTDPTKQVALDVSLLDTMTVVTLQVPNLALPELIATLKSDQIFEGLVQALTMYATESLTAGKIILDDSATDPTVNGEIQLNGNYIKAKSNGFVGNILTDNEDQPITIDGVTQTLKEWLLS